MAYRYLIYSTGTTYSGTILRESVTNNPTVGQASLFSNFVIPAIQPLYLWQVSGGNVIPNTDTKINNYQNAIAPPPSPNDNITYGQTTGITNTKLDKFVGVTLNIPLIAQNGNALSDSGYNVADIITAASGVTQAQFSYYTGTTAPAQFLNKAAFNVYSGQTLTNIKSRASQANIAVYTGATQTALNSKASQVSVATFTGTTLPANYYNKTQINTYTGNTATLIGTKLAISDFNTYSGNTYTLIGTKAAQANVATFTGTTLPANYLKLSSFNTYTGSTSTSLNLKTTQSNLAIFTGTTLPANYLKLASYNVYTGATQTALNSKASQASVAIFTGTTLPNTYLKLIGGTLTGDLFGTDLNLSGDLTVNGTMHIINTEQIYTKSDFIYLRSGATTSLGVGQISGLAVTKADGIHNVILGSDKNAVMRVGWSGDTLVALAGREDNPTNGWYAVWDSGTTKFNTYNLKGYIDTQDNARTLQANLAIYTGSTQTTLNSKTTQANLAIYTGATQTALNSKASQVSITTFTGTTLPANYLKLASYNVYTGATQTALNLKATQSSITTFTGTTLPANYYTKTQINTYTGDTNTLIGTKLNTSTFVAYTASTQNVSKKIQVISTGVTNANQIIAVSIPWNVVTVNASSYLYTGGTAVYIKNAANYELQYHVTLTNDNANQTHSIGGYIVKNNSTTINETATASVVVGPNSSGELSLPPVVLPLALNDKLELAVFRIGNAGTVNTVSGSVYLMLNELT